MIHSVQQYILENVFKNSVHNDLILRILHILQTKSVNFSCKQHIIWEYSDILTQKIIHESLMKFKNLNEFYQFFQSEYLGQNTPVRLYQNVSQVVKCPNTPNLYTTIVRNQFCNFKHGLITCKISVIWLVRKPYRLGYFQLLHCHYRSTTIVLRELLVQFCYFRF